MYICILKYKLIEQVEVNTADIYQTPYLCI
jgi:hypothetical protein